MAEPYIESIVASLKLADQRIDQAEKLLRLAEKAGQDVTIQRANLEQAKLDRDKWKQALKDEGYISSKD